jgi:predicted DNA-binding transcriptional regulator AlpA
MMLFATAAFMSRYWYLWEGYEMRRDKQLKIWVSQAELDAIDASAEANGVSRAEYVRSCSVGRPVKARNRLFRAQWQLERQKLREAAAQAQREELAAENKRIAAINRKWQAEQAYRAEAETLARKAGGAERWLAVMSIPIRPQADPDDRLMKAKEVARMLGVSPAWVRQHSNGLRRPSIPRVKLGKCVRFKRSSVLGFIESMEERCA